jgi:hypothetical protein
MDCYKHFSTIFWKFKWRIGYRKYLSLSKINRQWRKWRVPAKSLVIDWSRVTSYIDSKYINCTIRLNVCHSELFLPNLWKCRYHVYWNLSYPLSILKVIFSKSHNFDIYKNNLYASSCSAFQRSEWPTFAYKWNIKYEN